MKGELQWYSDTLQWYSEPEGTRKQFRLIMFMLYAAGFLSDCHCHWKVQNLPIIRQTAMYASVCGNTHACIVMYIEWVNKYAAKHVFPMVFDLSCNTENGNMRSIFLPKNLDFLSFEWYFYTYEISVSLEVFCDPKHQLFSTYLHLLIVLEK